MITKQELLDLIRQYNEPRIPGILGVFSASESKEMQQLRQLVENFPDGELDQTSLEALHTQLSTRVQPETETHRIYNLVRQQLGKSKNIPALPTSYVSEVLQVFLSQNYFIKRTDQLIAAINEISQRNLIDVRTRQAVLVLLLAISTYAAYNTDLRYLLTTKTMHAILTALLPKYFSASLVNFSFSQSMPKAIVPYAHYLPSMQWFLGLGLQVSTDFLSGESWYYTMAYVFGSGLEAAAKIVTSEKLIPLPEKVKLYAVNYPETCSLIKQGVEDISYYVGTLIGIGLYNCYLSSQQNNQQHSEKPRDKKEEPKREQKPKQEQPKQEQQKSRSNSNQQQKQQAFVPIALSPKEQELLENNRKCDGERTKCTEVALKVLRIKVPDAAAIKAARKTLSLFFHPDKCPLSAEICQEQMTYITNALRILSGR